MKQERFQRFTRRLATNASGAAAVELALILPFLGAVLLGMYAAWDTATRVEDMRDGLKGGAQYFLNGGLNDSVAQTVALSAWQNRPEQSSITVSRECRCGDAVHDCATICPDNTAPAVYVTLAAVGTDPSAVVAAEITQSQVVRVR